MKFDTAGNLTTGNVALTQAQLNSIAGTSGTWAAGGATLSFGSATAADRLTGAAVLYLLISLRGQLFRPDHPPLVPPGDPGVPPTQLPVSTVI